MLCTMMNSHPRILCHHEVFNPEGIRVALHLRPTDFSLGTMEEREADPVAFLDRIWSRCGAFPCVGFKFTHRQNARVFPVLLGDPDIAKIVLTRRNRLKAFVSSLIAEQLNEWEVYRQADLSRQRPRVAVDVDAFLDRVAFDDAYYTEIHGRLLATAQVFEEVAYEDLFDPAVHHRLVEFLGQRPTSTGLRIESVKQNATDLRQLVSNFEEVARRLNGTRFANDPYSVEN